MLKEQKLIFGVSAAVVIGGLAGAFMLASGGDDAATQTVARQPVQVEPVKTNPVAPKAENGNPILAKFGGTQEDPCGHLDGTTKKDCNKTVFRARDPQLLKSFGAAGQVKVNDYGRVCEEDGSVSGKWKGSASSVSYQVSINGVASNICIDHSGKNSKPVLGSGPAPLTR
jgi:hypothetical protein